MPNVKRRRKDKAIRRRSAGTASSVAGRFRLTRRRSHLRLHFWIGLGVLICFTFFEILFDRHAGGHELHLQTHHWLHSLVKPPEADSWLPVLVDISDIKPAKFDVTHFDQTTGVNHMEFTPRDDLERLVTKIASAKPVAIGVDIDLSLEPELRAGDELATNSIHFFETALALTQQKGGVPVFLGIRRTESLPPEKWLGSNTYAPLAASLDRPRGLVRQMPSGLGFGGRFLKSLSKALADAYPVQTNPATGGLPGWVAWSAKRISVKVPFSNAADFEVHEFLVDFSSLPRLMTNWIPSEKVFNKWDRIADNFSNRLVIIGDANPDRPADTAIVPGQVEPVPGVYVHACAAYTLQVPLWELESWVGLGLAFVLSFVALGFMHWTCLKYTERFEVSTVPLTVILTMAVIGVVLLIGWSLMRVRVMWLEMFAVCAVLVLHCLVEVIIASVNWVRLTRSWTDVGEAVTTVPHSEE